MTKKEKILETALTLFAREGFDAVSTHQIALNAGVSEGLIFKHYKSKQLLLESIMEQAECKIKEIFAEVICEENPTEVIRKVIELVYQIDEKEYDFWRLQFKLKWDGNYSNHEKMKPVNEKVEWAFSHVKCKNPELEANLLLKIIDSLAIAILQENLESQICLRDFLLEKYNVNE